MFNKDQKGISLIELIIVIAFAAILVVAVYAAILPGQRIGKANNATRLRDVDAIEKAIKSILLNEVTPPAAITDIEEGVYYSLVTSGSDTSGQYTCGELDQAINRIDLASTLESCLGEMPIDPDIDSGVDTGYYLIRRGDIFDVGYCNWYDAPALLGGEVLPLAGDGGGDWTNYSITETCDIAFGAGSADSFISVSGTGDDTFLTLDPKTLATNFSISPQGFTFSDYDNTIWVSGNSKIINVNLDGSIISEYTVSGVGSEIIYDSQNSVLWSTKFSSDQILKISPADGSVIATYDVGDGPYRMVFDTYSDSLWVSNYYGNTVSKIDPSDGSVLATYTVGTQPRYITFDSSTNSIWVLNYSDDTVSKIGIDSGTVNTYTPGFAIGSSITFDSSTNSIWLADNSGNNIYKLAATDGSITGTYSFTDPWVVYFDSSTNSIWVLNQSNGLMEKVSPADGSSLASYYVGRTPTNVLLDNYSGAIWVLNQGDYTLSKFDASTGNNLFVNNYTVGDRPEGVAFDSSTNSIWVANYADHTVTKLNASDGSVVGTYDTDVSASPYPYGVAFDSSTNSIWVTNAQGNNVAKIRASDGELLGNYAASSTPRGIAFDSSTNSIWVANFNSNNVTKLRASDGQLLGSYPAGTTPEGIAFDSSTNSIWVAGNSVDGTLTKISTADGSTTGTYGLGGGTGRYGKGVAFDPSTNSVWVAFDDQLSKFRASDGTELYEFTYITGSYSSYYVTYDENGYVWISTTGSVSKIDPSTNTIISRFSVPSDAHGIAYDSYTDSIWVASDDYDVVSKIPVAAYYSPAIFTSQILDTTVNTVFDTVTWNSTEPSNTSIEVKMRTSNSSSMTGATDWDSCSAISSGDDISANSCVTDTNKYIQYQVTLNTVDNAAAPQLDDITINYSADYDTLNNPYCGDTSCNGSENASSCPEDCSAVCPDSYCTHSETTATCWQDCGTSCGDAVCNGSESTATCPADCGTSCGDAVCNGDETCSTCESDCGICANSAPTVSDAGRTPVNTAGNQNYNVQLDWSDWTDPDGDTVEYQTVVYLGSNCSASVVATQAWTTNSYYNTNLLYSTYYSWKTKARDQNHQLESDFNSCYYYYTMADPGGSCPFVYLWDGEDYNYITDIKGQPIGFPIDHFKSQKTKYYAPNQVPLDGFEPIDGEYKIKFRETLKEMDYFDELKLLLVDHPEGYEIHSSTADDRLSLEDKKQEMILYTVKDPRLPVSAFDQDGIDVLQEVSEVDDKLAQNYDLYDSYIDLDFGSLDTRYAKLVIDGWSTYQLDRKVQKPFFPYVEVINEKGEWEKASEFGYINGDLKTMIVELYDKFKTDDHRLRVHVGYNFVSSTFLDRIRIDDSEPVDISITEVSPSKADLYHAGSTHYVYGTEDHRIIDVQDNREEDIDSRYFYGNFTKYGEVTELLEEDDDKFVIFRHGDALEVSFPAMDQSRIGYERTPVIHADVLYKIIYENKTGKYGEVENPYSMYPLPFDGMSQYPYNENFENYPNDREHQEYLDKWNTRVCEEGVDYCYDLHASYRILSSWQKDELDKAFYRIMKGMALPPSADGTNAGDIKNIEYAKKYYGYQEPDY